MSKDKGFVEQVFTSSKEEPNPVLLHFANGRLCTAQKDNALYFPAKNSEDKKNRAVVIASGNVYSGIVGEGFASNLTDSYLCVRNKETNKVRILPIDQAKLVNYVYQELEEKKFALLSEEASYDQIMRNFGGRKASRYMANKERNQINIGTVKEQLANTLEASDVLNGTLPVISAEDNADRLRPPINREAESFDEIFKLNDVIPMELLDRLDEEAAALFAADVDDIPINSDFLLNAIKTLKLSPDSNEKMLKMKIIIYMDALQALIQSRGRSLRKLELSKITEKVENDIRERFSDDQAKFTRNAFSNEKALCYYLVLGFMLGDKQELDVSVLTQELGIPKTKIIRFAKLVCATMRARTTMLVVRLPKKVKAVSFPYAGRRMK